MNAKSLITRVVAGSDSRKSRIHDEKGSRISASRLLRNGPKAVMSGLARLILNIRPAKPWISYDAQAAIAAALSPSSKVLEFGSGMSTIWFAKHAGSVVSIEDNRDWFNVIGDKIRGCGNVDYRFAKTASEYLEFPRDRYDLIMIDGSHRDRCVDAVLGLLAPGGIIYLDNSDKGVCGLTGDVPRAARTILEHASLNKLSIQYFTDFAPTQLFVQQGLMVRSNAQRH